MVTGKPRVTILVNYLNGSKFLPSLLESIGRQTFRDFETLIIDNASVVPVTQELAQQSQIAIVKVVRLEKTLRLYDARNLACKDISTEFIAFHDVDDIWAPQKLKSQMDFLAKREDIDLVFTGFRPFSSLTAEPRLSNSNSIRAQTLSLEELARSYSVPMSSLLVRTSALKDLGGFRADYEIIGDFDLTMRAAEVGKVAKLHKRLTGVRIHKGSTGSLKRSMQVDEMRDWESTTGPQLNSWNSWKAHYQDEIEFVRLISGLQSGITKPSTKHLLGLSSQRRRLAYLRFLIGSRRPKGTDL